MLSLRPSLLISPALLAPALAHAQSASPPTPAPASPLATLLATRFPFAILALLLYWFLRRAQSGPQSKRLADYMTRHEQHMARHEQHMTRLEDSLERIAKALEQQNLQ